LLWWFSDVHTVEVLVLSWYVDRTGGSYGYPVWSPVRLPRVLSSLVLRAVSTLL